VIACVTEHFHIRQRSLAAISLLNVRDYSQPTLIRYKHKAKTYSTVYLLKLLLQFTTPNHKNTTTRKETRRSQLFIRPAQAASDIHTLNQFRIISHKIPPHTAIFRT